MLLSICLNFCQFHKCYKKACTFQPEKRKKYLHLVPVIYHLPVFSVLGLHDGRKKGLAFLRNFFLMCWIISQYLVIGKVVLNSWSYFDCHCNVKNVTQRWLSSKYCNLEKCILEVTFPVMVMSKT